MNPSIPEYFSGRGDGNTNRPSPRRELQGPRPAALKVNKDSHKIRKPPVAPQPYPQSLPETKHQSVEDRQPIIIYAVSPKVIHTTASDFMNLVQRLTGNTSDTASSSAYGESSIGHLSPAARLASIEKTSLTSPKDKEITSFVDNNSKESTLLMGDFIGDTDVELGRVPGILSPAPTNLPQISSGFFSPASLPQISPGFFSPTVDPFMMGYNMFIQSPSTLFSAPIASPSPSSSYGLFNPFFDF